MAEEAKCFTVVVVAKWYNLYSLDEESQLYTTFITPFGHFKYLRIPYGLSFIVEHYNWHMPEAFERLMKFKMGS